MQVGPTPFARETVHASGDWRPAMRYFQRDGVTREDLTAAGVDVECRISKVGSATSYSRKKSVSGEAVYLTDGTDGDVEFVFLAAGLATIIAAAGEGDYDVEFFFLKAASNVARLVAKGTIELRSAVT